MSRVIVKNLPEYLDEAGLRKHFASQSKADITDVKIMRKTNGQSRRFGFVGFKEDTQAASAAKFFDQSFINTSQIVVELAKNMGDRSLKSTAQRKEEKRKREREEEESATKKARRDEKKKHKKERTEEESDPKLKEFLSVMGARQNARSWANDDILPDANKVAVPVVPEKESDDEYEEIRPNANGEEEDEKMIPFSKFDSNSERQAEDEDEEMIPLSTNKKSNEDEEMALLGGDNEEEKPDANMSDMEWLQMRRKRIVENKPKENGEENDITKETESEPAVAEVVERVREPSEKEKNIAKIKSSKRLFLRNILYSSTEEDFRQLFSAYGDVEEVHVSVDIKTNKSKGFAYVMFRDGEEAAKAYEELDKTTFQGRLLHILPGQPKRSNRLDEFDLKNLPLKKQNELKRKFAASKETFSWNSLYLNTDMVMETVANRLGISKSELINPESSDAAVQQALAETSVISNIRQYFESKGVDLTSFSSKEKSDTVILAKNLPFNTTMEEIADMFSQYGELKKVLMPPEGGIAIVAFKTAPQGRAAFTKLAYRRLRTSILYLEKGPKGLFEGDEAESTGDGVVAAEKKAHEVGPSAAEIVVGSEDNETDEVVAAIDRTSLFVKNLNFKTTTNDLTRVFKALEGFAVAQVKTKPDAKNPGKHLSMGFGFVEFNTKHDAEVAVKAMDGYVLDGHKLQLKLSHRGREGEVDNGAMAPKLGANTGAFTKIIIKNLPFEATKKDITKLFGTFGQLRSVRVPKKFDKRARGFAFAEFVTAKEAANALKALQGTHLLGRKLVMEYAQAEAENAEEEIERQAAKMQSQLTKTTLAGMRLSGKRALDLDEDGNLAVNDDE
ncbi:multiple RNA-binding domain-containing protein 1 [Trichomonascus vanleenenianus]|uniref:RNA-binding ribosome biosynthesis protein MRD1 n=1 Tax=Trichomonascus vanleenenianus TaxID=2268995 RepID=UPI003ECABFDB